MAFGKIWRKTILPMRIADRISRFDIVLLPDREHLTAHEAGENRNLRNADRDHCVGQTWAEKCRQRNRQDQEWDRQHRVDQTHDHGIHAPPI